MLYADETVTGKTGYRKEFLLSAIENIEKSKRVSSDEHLFNAESILMF